MSAYICDAIWDTLFHVNVWALERNVSLLDNFNDISKVSQLEWITAANRDKLFRLQLHPLWGSLLRKFLNRIKTYQEPKEHGYILSMNKSFIIQDNIEDIRFLNDKDVTSW